MTRRIERLNSLLKEVLTEVIRKEVKNPHLSPLFTVTRVEISKDLQHAKVYISVIGDDETKKKALAVLQSARGFIAKHAFKEVTMFHFPELNFILDESVEQQMHIESLISKIQAERKSRTNEES